MVNLCSEPLVCKITTCTLAHLYRFLTPNLARVCFYTQPCTCMFSHPSMRVYVLATKSVPRAWLRLVLQQSPKGVIPERGRKGVVTERGLHRRRPMLLAPTKHPSPSHDPPKRRHAKAKSLRTQSPKFSVSRGSAVAVLNPRAHFPHPQTHSRTHTTSCAHTRAHARARLYP
jgi:hypothetical protein